MREPGRNVGELGGARPPGEFAARETEAVLSELEETAEVSDGTTRPRPVNELARWAIEIV
jgi:hypothetical protein